jgi:hypothetical protein
VCGAVVQARAVPPVPAERRFHAPAGSFAIICSTRPMVNSPAGTCWSLRVTIT